MILNNVLIYIVDGTPQCYIDSSKEADERVIYMEDLEKRKEVYGIVINLVQEKFGVN